MRLRQIIAVGFLLLIALVWFGYLGLYQPVPDASNNKLVSFTVREGESAADLSLRLADEKVVRSSRLLRWFLYYKKLDTDIKPGVYTVEPPVTVARVAAALFASGVTELTITIIPGWDLSDVKDYLVTVTGATPESVTAALGQSAVDYRSRPGRPSARYNLPVLKDRPAWVSYEGYLAPETYRVYKFASALDIVDRLLRERDNQFTLEMYEIMAKQGRTVHEVMTMASLLEREVRHPEDRARVADIFWRRHDVGMGLQADSSVHYAVGKKGDVFTTAKDRASDNLWNTYKYPKLPPGPICNPSLKSIEAAIYPKANDYWYFLTTLDTGEVKYARTLREHNENARRFLRK